MKQESKSITINGIKIPLEFFEKNLKIKTKMDELFKRNDKILQDAIYTMREATIKAYGKRYAGLKYDFLLQCFKLQFYKKIIVDTINKSTSMNGSRFSFEFNITKLLTDRVFKEAIYGKEMYDTFRCIAFE